MNSISSFALGYWQLQNPGIREEGISCLSHRGTFLEHHPPCHFEALDRLLTTHTITPFNDRLGHVRPPEDYQRNGADKACREQLPFKIHSGPRHCVWLEARSKRQRVSKCPRQEW
jgi:hypothetical protein